MKFARYLKEALIPEWRKAYLDYRGLKKTIGLIKSDEEDSIHSRSEGRRAPDKDQAVPSSSRSRRAGRRKDDTHRSTPPDGSRAPSPSLTVVGERMYLNETDTASKSSLSRGPPVKGRTSRASVNTGRSSHKSGPRAKGEPSNSGKPPKPTTGEPRNLAELLVNLSPPQRLFFEVLDKELEKVVAFYNAREKEARARSDVLTEQLRELSEHREVYDEAYPMNDGEVREQARFPAIMLTNRSTWRRRAPAHLLSREQHDPLDYKQARSKLKKAMQEHYRGLELLDNYRILNLTGFRKALKKFEKVTNVRSAQKLYMNEKVESCSFAFPETLGLLRQKVEIAYAAGFSKGDRKKARDRLRADVSQKTHHFSTFRSGLWIGLGIPPFMLALVRSFDPALRAQMPEWGSLLQIYSAFFVLPIFALMLGINLLVWSQARINWVFIFDLDVRTAVDYREYFELPSFLFMTLCYAFWLSFSVVNVSNVSPTTWPLVWLISTIAMLLLPVPFFHSGSRLWFVKMIGKLCTAGSTKVEFADFWLGDQLCSLTYTLANFYVFGCAYDVHWNDVYSLCNPANTWAAGLLSALPGLARLVQCIRRWIDSGLKVHLLNAGKYGATIAVYAVYYYWRHLGAQRDLSFVFWCLLATTGSIYTSSWDLLMDWSLLRPNAPHKFLRQELLYTQYTTAYYFAMVSNVCLRFSWLFFIPAGGLSPAVRGFMFAVLECLRRWQWNFYRVENEHIGNADRYRVTREIPLPYSLNTAEDDGDDSDQDVGQASPASATSRQRDMPDRVPSARPQGASPTDTGIDNAEQARHTLGAS